LITFLITSLLGTRKRKGMKTSTKASAYLDDLQSGILQIAIGIGNLPLEGTTGTGVVIARGLMDQAGQLSEKAKLVKVLLMNGGRDFDIPDPETNQL
jgi:hypothetical protein